MRSQSLIHLLFMVLFLTGCQTPSEFVAPLGYVAEGRSSTEDSFASVSWFPAQLEKGDCQSIDGEYKDVGWFENNRQNTQSLLRKFDFRVHRDSKNIRDVEMQAGYEVYKKIPYSPRDVGMTYDPKTKIFTKRIFNDESTFYKSAVTSIKRKDSQLEVVLMDNKGSEYEKSILNLEHPQIGCDNGMLTIRTTSSSGGAEGAYGTAYATEMRFRKLPDGSLQISSQIRQWYYSRFRGLIGISPDGKASGNEPRKSETNITFPVSLAKVNMQALQKPE